MKPFDLPENRLATTDELGHRVYLYPAEVRGRYKNLRDWIHPILILFYLVGPWIRLRGEPLILLDIVHQQFTLFGFTFWGDDAPYLILLVSCFIFTVAFVTSRWGRMWCGWTCPQTVFIESVYRRIERWVEGPNTERRRLASQPPTIERRLRRALTWTLFTLFSLIISHTFVAYFVGSDQLMEMMQHSPSESPAWFIFMAIVTAVFLFDFGWFREQFCVIACPYGRWQSVMLDEHSKTIVYDAKRGEPRKGTETPGQKSGDCVNCYRCVQVCPTGIDIRRGTQMECVSCTACIDACDEVMEKTHRPAGLIRYASLAEVTGIVVKGKANRWIFLGLASASFGALFFFFRNYQPFFVSVLRAHDVPYREVIEPNGDHKGLNHFQLIFENKTGQTGTGKLTLSSEWTEKGAEIVAATSSVSIEPRTRSRIDFFLKAPLVAFNEQTPVRANWVAEFPSQTTHQQGEVYIPLVGASREN